MTTAPITHDPVASARAAHPAGRNRRPLHPVESTAAAAQLPTSADVAAPDVEEPASAVIAAAVDEAKATTPASGTVRTAIGGALTGPVAADVTGPVEHHELMNTVLHHALRRDLRRIGEVLRRPFSPNRRAAMVEHIRFVLRQLHHHHTIEDDVIWPAVLRVRPELQDLFEQMEAEHGQLASVVERLTTATDNWSATGDEAHRVAVRQAAIDLEAVLEPHLEHEEADAMPVIAAALTPEQWAPLDGKIHQLGTPSKMARELFWLLDELDDTRRAVVYALPPRPVFHALKLFFGRREARRRRLLWG